MREFIEKYAHYGINQRFQSDNTFLSICESEKIELIDSSGKFSWFMTVMGEPFIVLPKRLKGLKRTFAAFHELGHYFRHFGLEPNRIFFHGLASSKDETEADAFALVALIPLWALKDYEFLETHPNAFARKLFAERKKLFFLYGI